jgi:putative hemolysin
VLANGVLAGAEIAIVALRKSRVEHLLQLGSRRAAAVKALQDDPERFLATVQIGITVISAAAGAFGGAAFARDLAPLFATVPWLAPYANQLAFVLVITLISYLSLVLGELVPKSLGLRYSEGYALLLGPPLLFLSSIARPFVRLLTASSNLVLRFFGDSTSFTETRLSAEELRQLVGEAAKEGSVDPAIGEIAARAIDFADLTAYHAMVPRAQVVAIPRDAKPDDIKRILLERGYTRMPVYEGRLDHVIGYVTARDLLLLFWEKGLVVLEDAIRLPLFVPATVRAIDLLGQLRERHVQLAIVVDEEGAMMGIVTLEDLVEELVGEIADEHRGEPGPSVEPQPDGSVLVSAALPVREANRSLGLDLPDGPGRSTVAGLCIHLAGRIPEPGARVVSPDGTELEVVAATARRVLRVRIRLTSQAPATGKTGPSG